MLTWTKRKKERKDAEDLEMQYCKLYNRLEYIVRYVDLFFLMIMQEDCRSMGYVPIFIWGANGLMKVLICSFPRPRYSCRKCMLFCPE